MARHARLSPLTPPEVALKRNLQERLDRLFDDANIRRFDPDLLDKAGELLDVADSDSCDDDNAGTKTFRSHHEYCRHKADVLLNLGTEGSDEEYLNTTKNWLRKADMLLGLADDSQSDEDPLFLFNAFLNIICGSRRVSLHGHMHLHITRYPFQTSEHRRNLNQQT